jgi:ABC-2 type transport system ATP-binding protein
MTRMTGRTGESRLVEAPGSGPAPAITVSGLRKTYGDTVAVDDVSFTVAEGEIFGILGPNGAGKTTALECVTGLRSPDAGVVEILGLDPQTDRAALHGLVGVQLQASALPNRLRVGEILDLFHSFYREPADLGQITDALGLRDRRHDYYKTLSGGLKQRLSIALALLGRPRIAVFDEMTAGLDPQARRDTWQLVEDVRDRGVTIVLVTHYMEEAQRLCDRVALIDRGRVVALDSPEGLADRAGTDKRVRFTPSRPFNDRLLTDLPQVHTVEHRGPGAIATGSGDLVNAVVLTLAKADVTAGDLHLDSADLEDAFVQLTGRHLDGDIGRIHR